MRCDETERRLNELLDDRREPFGDAELRAHLADCAACYDLAMGYSTLIDGVESPPFEASAPAGLAARVVEVLESQPRRRIQASRATRSSWRRFTVSVSTAATVMLIASPLSYFWFATRPTAPEEQVATEQLALSASSLHLPTNLDSVTVYEELCLTTGRSLATIPSTFRRVAPWRDVANYPGAVRPMAVSMEATLSALLHVWPQLDSSVKVPSGDTGFVEPRSPLEVV